MFRELQNDLGRVCCIKNETEKGSIFSIKTEKRVRHAGQLGLVDGKTLHVLRIADEYAYLTIDNVDIVESLLFETDGSLPEPFIGPNGCIWTINTCLDSDDDRVIYLPMEGRTRIDKIKKYTDFVGDYICSTNEFALFYKVDMFGSKPDQLCRVDFNKGNIKGRKIVKIPDPHHNEIYFEMENIIHILGGNQEKVVHRKMNINGEVIGLREINIGVFDSYRLIKLSFDEESTIVVSDQDKLWLLKVNPNGKISRSLIFQLEEGNSFYSLWPPVIIDSNRNIIRFTYDNGNGWIVLFDGKLINCFIRSKEVRGYIDCVTKQSIELPYEDSIISGITASHNSKYQVSFYNKEESSNNSEINIAILSI